MTLKEPRTMPIEQLKASLPGVDGAVNSITFWPRERDFTMLRSGMTSWLVHPCAPAPSTTHRTGTPALIVRLLGSYPARVTFIATSWMPFVIVGAEPTAAGGPLRSEEKLNPVSVK